MNPWTKLLFIALLSLSGTVVAQTQVVPNPAQPGEAVILALAVQSASVLPANDGCIYAVVVTGVERFGFLVQVTYELVYSPSICGVTLPPLATVPLGSFQAPGLYVVRATGALGGTPIEDIDTTFVVTGSEVLSVPAGNSTTFLLLGLALLIVGMKYFRRQAQVAK